MENTREIIDFGAIEPSSLPAPSIEEITEQGSSTVDDFMDDLDKEIEEQDIKELDLNEIPVSGIRKEEQAEFLIHRYLQLKEECDNINQAANSKIESYRNKVTAWRDKELSRREGVMAYCESILESYAHSRLDGKKKRSLNLTEGTIGFCKQQPAYDTNPDKIRDFLLKLDKKEQDLFLEELPKKVKWGDLKKAGRLDGGIFRYGDEAVPGVVVTLRPDKFIVK